MSQENQMHSYVSLMMPADSEKGHGNLKIQHPMKTISDRGLLSTWFPWDMMVLTPDLVKARCEFSSPPPLERCSRSHSTLSLSPPRSQIDLCQKTLQLNSAPVTTRAHCS